MKLFDESFDLKLPDADIRYHPNFLSKEEADIYFDHFIKNVPWRHDDIKIFGKTFPQPRLTALYGNNGKTYTYSNITMKPLGFDTELKGIKQKLEQKFQVVFSTCLLNLYRDGQDSNGWHSDDEKELGTNPTIASISLGEERFFHLKHKTNKELKQKILLEHGSLLLMQGSTQHFWQHQIPKTKRKVGKRVNLTFRLIH
ncbi:MAG: alpha-ketoglutarate-dependent dioxygenase AlkB [Allomuricauda sp.]|nr:MAG: alpha-ketoglutarate-dependent dioxygenase AlkB [Allomuricauda sp.]